MALFRRVRRMFRSRLCLLFVLVWIATVFLCGLEVMKFKTTSKRPGLSSLSETSNLYQLMGGRQHQRHRVAKDSRDFALPDGFREDHGKLMIEKDDNRVLDKRIESDDGVPMEAKKAFGQQNSDGNEDLEEHEGELDSAGIKNTGINIDSPDNKEDHEKEEEGLEVKTQEEEELQHRHEEFVEEETTYSEEQEEEEFEKEGEEEINEDKQGEEKQQKQQEEEKDEKLQREQNYEKYRKENAETSQKNDYFPQRKYEEEDEAEDHDKEVDEQEGQVQGKKQEERNQNSEQGKQDGLDKSQGLEEQDGDEEDNYRNVVNQSNGLKNGQRKDMQIEEKIMTQEYKESVKHANKGASMSKTQSFKMAHDDQGENEGASLNKMRRNDDLTVQDEDQENKGKFSHEHDDVRVQDEYYEENIGKSSHKQQSRARQDDIVTKHVPSTQIAQLEGSRGTQSAMAEPHLGTTKITSTKKYVEGDSAAPQNKESRDTTNLREKLANRIYGEDRGYNISEMNIERKERRGETVDRNTEMEEKVKLQTDRTEGDVELKQNGYSTEVSEMDEDKATLNKEAGEENNATKATELANQGPGETEKHSHSDRKVLQGYKATIESVENERNKERRDEVHKYGTSLTENKETAEQANDDEQSKANENGRTKISAGIEMEDEQNKGNMKYEEGKLNAEGQKQVYEGKTKRNDPGNEERHKVKNESERSDGTENGEGSKENKANQEEKGAVEENHAIDKRQRQDVERHQAEGETKSHETERPSSRSTSLPWTGQPVEDDRDRQQHVRETGNEQDSFESNKTSSKQRTVRLAQPATKPIMSEELLLRRQDERKHTINTFCRKQRFNRLPNRSNLENLVVIDQAKLIYCAIPKVASTEWREALSVELGHGRIQGKKAQNRTLWKHLNEYTAQNITEKLKKFRKFLFVREPFARLLSAYKSKFLAGNEYYLKNFGRKIIHDFRRNATEHAKNTGDGVTFLEFLKYITVTGYYDEHWRPYDNICHMCSVNYDFIGHLETIEEDAPFLLKKLGIDDYVTFKSSRRSHSSSELLKYYSQIPASYIKRLGRIYFKDFEMFGYPFPGPLKSIVEDST